MTTGELNALRTGVVGCGYVGLTTAVCLAERGFDTVCVDVDAAKIERLRCGVVHLDEPDLADVLTAGLHSGLLRFSTAFEDIADRQVVFVCVPTPSSAAGAADLTAVHAVVEQLASTLTAGAVIAVKSTVPVGTTRALAKGIQHTGIRVVSNPEFLREGHAVHDCRHPERVVIGAAGDDEINLVDAVNAGPPGTTMRMNFESAELAKYASNAYLAVKLSYANSMAQLCSRVGADVRAVTSAMGADPRIGPQFLLPGPGWGGSCLPKDTAALMHTGRSRGVALHEVEAARRTNDEQSDRVIAALESALQVPLADSRIAVLGLTFKAGTSDVRDSPALSMCRRLDERRAHVTAFDPRLSAIDPGEIRASATTTVDDPYLATKDTHAILVLTEWPEFRQLDWARIAREAPGAVVIDTRNLLEGSSLADAGLRYLGNGVASGY
jgi:UDPglucose 6-dehydrogenase